MDEEQNENGNDILKAGKKGAKKLEKEKEKKDKAKSAMKTMKKLFEGFMKLPWQAKIVALIIFLVIGLVVFMSSAYYVKKIKTYDGASTAITVIRETTSKVVTDLKLAFKTNNNTSAKEVVPKSSNVTKGKVYNSYGNLEILASNAASTTGNWGGVVSREGNSWVLKISDKLKESLKDKNIDIDKKSEQELFIELLKINGLDEKNFLDEELELLPLLLKAEVATQFLDLRPEDEMYKTNGTYKAPRVKKDDLEIPGTIHLKRINSKDMTAQNLSYVDYETFKTLTSNQEEAKKHFSFDNDGNLVIYTWSHTTVNYTYSGEVPDDLKLENEEEYYLTEEILDYKPLVDKYTLPFNVVVALLITTKDVKFTEQVVDLAFTSNIEIGIIEEYDKTVITTTTNYYETVRGYQYLRGGIIVNGQDVIEPLKEHGRIFVDLHQEGNAEDIEWIGEEWNDGTRYTYSGNKDYKVIEETTYETNNYQYGIINADTWYIKISKDYSFEHKVEPPIENVGELITGVFTKSDNVEYREQAQYQEEEALNNLESAELRQNIRERVENALSAANAPERHRININITVNDEGTATITSNVKINTVTITSYNNRTGRINTGSPLVKNAYSFTIGSYLNTPGAILYCDHFDLRFENGEVRTNISGTGTRSYEYTVAREIQTADYRRLVLTNEEYKKIDTQTTVVTNEEKWEVIEGVSDKKIYDKKDEKFLKAISDNRKSELVLQDIPSWFFNMIADYDERFTVIIGYLFDKYYERETEYDINSVISDLEIYSFNNLGSGIGWWWPIGADSSGNPLSTSITSHFGERWGTTHKAIDIGVPRGTPVLATRAGVVKRVVDGYR